MNLSTPAKCHCTPLWNADLFRLLEVSLYTKKIDGSKNTGDYVVHLNLRQTSSPELLKVIIFCVDITLSVFLESIDRIKQHCASI